jgi:Domain of unknown function (DUF5664)
MPTGDFPISASCACPLCRHLVHAEYKVSNYPEPAGEGPLPAPPVTSVPKVNLQRIPWEAVEMIGQVMMGGSQKHGEGVWKVCNKDLHIQSLLRHVVAYMCGERRDPESGLPTMAHVACRAMMLAWRDVNEEKEANAGP